MSSFFPPFIFLFYFFSSFSQFFPLFPFGFPRVPVFPPFPAGTRFPGSKFFPALLRAFHDPVLRLVIIAAISTHLLKVTECIALLAFVFGGWALLLSALKGAMVCLSTTVSTRFQGLGLGCMIGAAQWG